MTGPKMLAKAIAAVNDASRGSGASPAPGPHPRFSCSRSPSEAAARTGFGSTTGQPVGEGGQAEDGPGGSASEGRGIWPRRDAVAWDVARELAHAAALPGRAVSRSLDDVDGCVLATPLISPVAVPPVDRAAMDGYAVRGDGPWRIVGQVKVGATDPGELADGQAVGIVTGAAVPVGATSVVRSEDAVVVDARLEGPAVDGRHVRGAGEECRVGEQLLPAGVVVGPAMLGLVATVGLNRLTVIPQPTVAALVTGDELVHRGRSGPGRVRDAIGPMLPGLVTRAGAQLVGSGVPS